MVAHPWQPGMRQLGVDVAWTGNAKDSSAVVSAKSRRIINYAISLNANSVALTFPFYTYGMTSSTLYTDKVKTPSPAHIAAFLSAAAASHMRVTLRPLLDEKALLAQNPLGWRGIIAPASSTKWFASYQKLLLPYLRVAESGKAATFVIATELNSMEGRPQWAAFVAAASRVYHGELAYDENFDSFEKNDHNLPLPVYGVDAYPRFKLPDSATVTQLTEAWKGWLGTHDAATLHRTVLSEVGITATAGAFKLPADWQETTHSPIVPVIQQKWYEAVCNAVTAYKLSGIYWWEVSFDADPVHPGSFLSDRLTFLDRPAEQQVAACFASLATDRLPG